MPSSRRCARLLLAGTAGAETGVGLWIAEGSDDGMVLELEIDKLTSLQGFSLIASQFR